MQSIEALLYLLHYKLYKDLGELKLIRSLILPNCQVVVLSHIPLTV